MMASLSIGGFTEQQLVNQTILIMAPDGTYVPIPLATIDANQFQIVVQTIGYSVELGASIVMLVVLLVMTPKTKFWRLHTYLNIAALCSNIIRTVLLAIYFKSSWLGFFALYTTDYDYVTTTDTINSIASSAMSIPQNIMVMWALVLQAWAMVRFWPQAYKAGIIVVSIVLVLLEIGFMGASQTYQIMTIYLPLKQAYDILANKAWVRMGYLGLEVATICWFCVLFIGKLVTHLYKNRSFLPTTKGLGPMDALVMTNGVLMLIPGKTCQSSFPFPGTKSHVRRFPS